jgi:xylulokinase
MGDAVLVIDAGTSSVKAGLVDCQGRVLARSVRRYSYTIPAPHAVELDFENLWSRTADAVRELATAGHEIHAIGLSVLCPGLVPLDTDGVPLRPAIIHMDRRSVRCARAALQAVGKDRFLSVAGNLPFPGGISLTSALWVKSEEPEIYRRTRCFGHTNTFLAHRLTGAWGMDPSNASFTGLYNTLDASGWNAALVTDLGLETDRLPPIVDSAAVVGVVLPDVAARTGLPVGVPVVMGAADTACAALGADVITEGDILNSTGTVEVMVLATAHPVASERYLVRAHAIPGMWLIMNILSAGGEAVEWVRRTFYSEMDREEFFSRHLPRVIAAEDGGVRMSPYLSGDRTSFTQRLASYRRIGLGTTRDDFLQATCRATVDEMRKRFRYYEAGWRSSGRIRTTGGGSQALMDLKARCFPGMTWEEVPDATIRGAARLAWKGLGASPLSASSSAPLS